MRRQILIVMIAVLLGAGWYGRAELASLAGFEPPAGAGAHENGAAKGAGGGRARGAGGHGRGGEGGPTPVTVATATAGSLPIAIDTIGRVVPVASTVLTSETTGIVSEVAARDGQRVKTGDLIARLDDRSAAAQVNKDKATLERDQATLDNAQASLERITSLVHSGASSKQAGDDARAALAVAQANAAVDQAVLQSDEVTLSKTEIRAPFDGRLGVIAISAGALVQPGTAIVTDIAMKPVYAQFTLPETALDLAIKAFHARSMTVRVTGGLSAADALGMAGGSANAAASAGGGVGGTVVFIDNSVDVDSATFSLRAQLPNDDETLFPGETLNVHAMLGQRNNLVLVPNVAVEPRDDGSVVYLVKADNSIEIRPVEVALRNADTAGLSAGLAAGDRVVTEGQANLMDGSKVSVSEGGSSPERRKGRSPAIAGNPQPGKPQPGTPADADVATARNGTVG